jgi:hypothetical protein
MQMHHSELYIHYVEFTMASPRMIFKNWRFFFFEILSFSLVPSYYCSYSLFKKIRDKGKIVSAGY